MFKNARTMWFIFFLAALLILMWLEQVLNMNPAVYVSLIILLMLAYTYVTFRKTKDK